MNIRNINKLEIYIKYINKEKIIISIKIIKLYIINFGGYKSITIIKKILFYYFLLYLEKRK